MPAFEPSGDLLSDLQQCIETQTQMFIRYVDRKGQPSERNAAPLEIRDDSVYIWDMEKNALRLMKLQGITSYEVLDATFDKEQFTT